MNKTKSFEYLIRILSGLVLCFILLSFALVSKSNPIAHTNLTVLQGMIDSVKKLKNASFKLKASERVNGKMLDAESEIMLNINPKMVYFKSEKRKLNIILKKDWNDNKALVKMKSFPYTTLNLDPNGNLMRKNQHYTMNELGFHFFATCLATALLKDKQNISKNLVLKGKKVFGAYNCNELVYEDLSFTYHDYTVLKGESVSSIAKKFNVNDYAIRAKNELHSFYGALETGKKIKVPSNYCKKMILYVDEKTMLPVFIETFDEVGKYESYIYLNLKVNQNLKAEDFKKFID